MVVLHENMDTLLFAEYGHALFRAFQYLFPISSQNLFMKYKQYHVCIFNTKNCSKSVNSELYIVVTDLLFPPAQHFQSRRTTSSAGA